MESQDDWTADPRWFQLSPAKQATALNRMEKVKDFLALAPRTARDADRMAAELGMKRSRFYDLIRNWKATGSPIELAPFGEPVAKLASTMPKARQEAVRAVVRDAMSATGDRSPPAILRHVAKLWRQDAGRPPSPGTVRRYVADMADEDTIGRPIYRREGDDVARSYGDVLVVDHVAADLFVTDGERRVRPTLSLALDLFSGDAVGCHLDVGAPTAASALAALVDAERRSGAFDGIPAMPRIALSATYEVEWTGLLARLREAGLAVSVKRASGLRRGGPTMRILRGRLGRLKLLARKAHGPDLGEAEYDPRRHLALTIQQARMVVEENMTASASEGRIDGVPLSLGLRDSDMAG